MHWDSIKSPDWGPSRAWGGVGFNITLRLGPGYKDRPSPAAWGRFGAEWSRLGLSGVGEGWACIGIQLNYSKTRPWLQA